VKFNNRCHGWLSIWDLHCGTVSLILDHSFWQTSAWPTITAAFRMWSYLACQRTAWKRRSGRPSLTWLRTGENLGPASAYRRAQKRSSLRSLVDTATLLTRPGWWWWWWWWWWCWRFILTNRIKENYLSSPSGLVMDMIDGCRMEYNWQTVRQGSLVWRDDWS